MKNPLVLNEDQTCCNCGNLFICRHYGQMKEHLVQKGVFANAPRPKFDNLFVALASACVSFDYQPDPPSSDDEPTAPVTLVLQIPHGESQVLVTNLQAELAGHGATLHTPDMREVL